MIQSVESHCAGTAVAPLEESMRIGLKDMNAAIQAVRAEPCGQFIWHSVAPSALVIYPFIHLVKGLWSAVMPMVTTEFTGFGGCSTVSGWSSPNNRTADAFT